MKYTYEIVENYQGVKIIKRVDEDGQEAWIPVDEANSDYQRYLNPEAEQSTPMVIHEASAE
jgi:hypothetical protein